MLYHILYIALYNCAIIQYYTTKLKDSLKHLSAGSETQCLHSLVWNALKLCIFNCYFIWLYSSFNLSLCHCLDFAILKGYISWWVERTIYKTIYSSEAAWSPLVMYAVVTCPCRGNLPGQSKKCLMVRPFPQLAVYTCLIPVSAKRLQYKP